MRFSVVIPLEFHRGLAQRCIRGWSHDQTFARGEYEILVAAPEGHPVEELREIAAVLGDRDRVLKYPLRHDIALVAEAAQEARGSYLVFTESHCLPEPDFLERAEDVLREHPEWSGFSGRSEPMTHNLLSEIEAEMYQKDISHNMLRHEWLKVLDQCFVISSEAYRKAGGIEPEYGHFAEWLFAARCHRASVVIGYDERPAVRHFYAGDLAELEEFTADFSIGQILFASRSDRDECADLFEEVAEWQARHETNPLVAGMIVGILWADLFSCFRMQRCGRWPGYLSSWPWREAASWLQRKHACTRLSAWRLQRQIGAARAVVSRCLARGNRSAAKEAFLRLMHLVVKRARRLFVAKATAAGNVLHRPPHGHAEWRAGRRERFATVGMYGLECRERTPFRWSRPVAAVQLPDMAGPVRVTIVWSAPHDEAMRFYLGCDRVPPCEVRHVDEGTTELTLREGTRGAMLAFVCTRRFAPHDKKPLGVAVASVHCQPAA